MKHLTTTTLSTLVLFSLVGCGGSAPVAPSQNSALNKVSGSSGKEKAGIMQTTMDDWFKNEWTPTVNADEEIQKKYLKVQTTDNAGKQEVKYVEETKSTSLPAKDAKETTKYVKVQRTNADGAQEVKYVEDEDRNFTLQEYVDKSAAYIKAHPSDYEKSNVKKLESMPIIGK